MHKQLSASVTKAKLFFCYFALFFSTELILLVAGFCLFKISIDTQTIPEQGFLENLMLLADYFDSTSFVHIKDTIDTLLTIFVPFGLIAAALSISSMRHPVLFRYLERS